MVWLGFGHVRVTTIVLGSLTFWILASFLRRRKKTPPGPWGVPLFGALPQLVIRASSVGPRRVFQDWYFRYGPIYSLKLGSVHAVVLNDFQSIKDMLVHPDFQNRMKFDVALGRPGDGLVMSDGRVWLEQRKFVHQHFREFGVGKASFDDRVASEANFLTEALLQFEGTSMDLEHLVNNAASNVISSVSFGRRFDYDDESFQKVLQKLNENMDSGLVRFSLSVFLPFTKYLPMGGGKRMSDNLTAYCNFHKAITDEHKASLDEDNIRDAMDAFLIEIKNKAGTDLADVFNDDNMLWTIGDLFAAGTETTTTTLRWIFLFLLNNPDVETKLRAQLDSVVGRSRLPRYSDRPNLPYLDAVISEALRLGTVCTVSLPHVASSDVTFHGYHIPKGSIMIPNFHVLFTESSKWEDPERFWPERFLDDEGKFVKPEEFIPFSTGRRLCIGEQLARMELFIFTSHIMQKMKFSVPEGQEIPSLKGTEGFSYSPKPYEVFITKCEE